MIWIAQDFINHLFICQVTHGFKTWMIRRTGDNPNAATYESFQLLAVFGYSETPPSWWGIFESYTVCRASSHTTCARKTLKVYRPSALCTWHYHILDIDICHQYTISTQLQFLAVSANRILCHFLFISLAQCCHPFNQLLSAVTTFLSFSLFIIR